MGALLGLLCGLGIVLMLWQPRDDRSTRRSHLFARWVASRRELLQQAGLGAVSPARMWGIQLLASIAGGLAAWLVTASLMISLICAVFAFLAPSAIVKSVKRRRTRELRHAWPELIDNLASAVHAGLSLPEALSSLATRGPMPLRPAFLRFAASYRLSGRFTECLDQLKVNLSDPVGDKVCESLRIARHVGGTDLGRLLRTLSAFLRQDVRIRSEMETRQGWTINAARLAVASPWLVLLLLATQHSTLAAFDTSQGRLLLAGGAMVTVIAYRMMLRIGQLPDERRVLK